MSRQSCDRKACTPPKTAYPFNHDNFGGTVHQFTQIFDPGGLGEKVWYFFTDGSQFNAGLVVAKEDRQDPGSAVKVRNDYTWVQDSNGNPYVGTVLTTVDPGTGNQMQKKVTQSVNINGNVTLANLYDFGDLNNPVRVFNNNYLSDANYTSRNIYNRLTSSAVAAYLGGAYQGSATLATNYYDNQNACSGYSGTLGSVSGAREHDDANYGTGFLYRGNLTVSTSLAGTVCAGYDMLGNSGQQQDVQGRQHNETWSPSANYAVPSNTSVGPYSDSMSWNTFLGLTQDTNQNNATSSVQFDSYARPTQTTAPTGAVTTYTYTTSPPTVTEKFSGKIKWFWATAFPSSRLESGRRSTNHCQ